MANSLMNIELIEASEKDSPKLFLIILLKVLLKGYKINSQLLKIEKLFSIIFLNFI